MELTGNAQSDLCPERAAILQSGVAQVAALISGSHLRDVQGPVRQQGQPLTARRGAQLRAATADNFPSIFCPGRRPRRQNAGGGTRKSHDVAGCDRQCWVVGTFGPKCGCDEPRHGETSTVRRLRRSPVSPGRLHAVKTHLSSTNRRVEKIELRGSLWSTFQQVTSSSKGENKWLPVQTSPTSSPVWTAVQPRQTCSTPVCPITLPST